MTSPSSCVARWWIVFAGGVLLALAFAPASADIHIRKEFAAPETRPRKLALLPVQAELLQGKFGAPQDIVAETEPLEALGTSSLAAELERRGYAVRLVSREEIESDQVLVESRRRLEKRYEELRARLHAKPYELETRRFTLGKEARLLAAHLGVEGIAVGRMNLMAVRGGRTAVTYIFGFGDAPYAAMDLGIVDGSTGDVAAWFHGLIGASSSKIHEHADELIPKLVSRTLETYPAFDEVLSEPNEPQQLIGRIGADASGGDYHSTWYVSGKRAIDSAAAAGARLTDEEVITKLELLLDTGTESPVPDAQQDSPDPQTDRTD